MKFLLDPAPWAENLSPEESRSLENIKSGELNNKTKMKGQIPELDKLKIINSQG